MSRQHEVLACLAQAMMSIGKAASLADDVGYHNEAHRLRMQYHSVSELYEALGETMGKQSARETRKT